MRTTGPACGEIEKREVEARLAEADTRRASLDRNGYPEGCYQPIPEGFKLVERFGHLLCVPINQPKIEFVPFVRKYRFESE